MIFFLSVLLVLSLVPLKPGRFVLLSLGKTIIAILIIPYKFCSWLIEIHRAKRRRRNYEILGRYVALFDNNPEIIKYFRNLIECGIVEEELQAMLEANISYLRNFEIEAEREQSTNKLQQEQRLKKIAAEQQQILLQSRLSLEQIKFREQLLDQLYQKIRKKYQL